MREIEFKAKCQLKGKWMYGYYRVSGGKHYINSTLIHPETLGQFTGKTVNDDYYNGDDILVETKQKIYEHDRVCYLKKEGGVGYGDICYDEEMCVFEIIDDDGDWQDLGDTYIIALAGNIHDMKRGEQ